MISPNHHTMLRQSDPLDTLVRDALRASLCGREPSARVRDDLLRAAAHHSAPVRSRWLADHRRRRRSGLWREVDRRAVSITTFGSMFLALEACRTKSALVV